MSDFPESWQLSTLADVGEWKGGGTPSKAKPAYWKGEIPWVSPKDMKSDIIRFSEDSINEIAISESSASLIPAGAILVVTRSGILRHTLPLAVAGRNLAINQDLKAITVRPGIENSYVFQYMKSNSQDILDSCMKSGTTVESIETSQLKNFPIPIPPLPEQKKIAEILSGIDTAVNHLKRHHGKQDFLKKSLLNTLIFNSCNPGDPGNGNHHYLGDISTRITDGTHQAVKTSEQGTIPFLYVSCVRDGMIDWDKSAFISEEQYAIATQGRQPSPGDILYTAVGSYGNAAMVTTDRRFCFQRHIALIQLDKKKAVPKFIELALSLDQTKRSVDQVVAGNAQPTLTLGELRKLQIPLPSQDRQQQICDIISPLEKKMSALEIKIIALSNLKQAISADLLSGRKRVSV
jgi:type I restriction enzyme S subunit